MVNTNISSLSYHSVRSLGSYLEKNMQFRRSFWFYDGCINWVRDCSGLDSYKWQWYRGVLFWKLVILMGWQWPINFLTSLDLVICFSCVYQKENCKHLIGLMFYRKISWSRISRRCALPSSVFILHRVLFLGIIMFWA